MIDKTIINQSYQHLDIFFNNNATNKKLDKEMYILLIQQKL